MTDWMRGEGEERERMIGTGKKVLRRGREGRRETVTRGEGGGESERRGHRGREGRGVKVRGGRGER